MEVLWPESPIALLILKALLPTAGGPADPATEGPTSEESELPIEIGLPKGPVATSEFESVIEDEREISEFSDAAV